MSCIILLLIGSLAASVRSRISLLTSWFPSDNQLVAVLYHLVFSPICYAYFMWLSNFRFDLMIVPRSLPLFIHRRSVYQVSQLSVALHGLFTFIEGNLPIHGLVVLNSSNVHYCQHSDIAASHQHMVYY